MTTSSEEEASLPEGWTTMSIGQACNLNPGKPSIDALPKGAMVTFVPMPAVDEDLGAITNPQERPYTDVRKGFTSFRNEDVIFAKITPCMENGKAAVARHLINGLGFGSTEFHVLRPNGVAIPEYLYHFIRQQSFRDAASEEMTGSVGQKRVPADYLRNRVIPVPPLDEQRRIVTKVETLLAHGHACRDRLSQVPAILKKFREAVLAAACDGRLTETWTEEAVSESASSLVKRIARDHRTNTPTIDSDSEPREGWCRVNIGFLAQPTLGNRPYVTSGSRGWAKLVSNEGPFFIRSENINTNSLRLADAVRVEAPPGAEAKRTQVKPGDLLLTITGNNVGKTAVVPKDCPKAHVSQHVAIIRLHSEIVTDFIWLWMQSPQHGQGQLRKFFYGETKPGLNLEQVKSVFIDLPRVEEQHEIVRRTASLFRLAEFIEQRVVAATERAERLTQAVLSKAFRGELVPTEAELARIEGRDYVSASQLFERTKPGANPLSKPKRAGKENRMTTRSSKKSGERKPLRAVLEEAKKGLSSEDLFEQSGFDVEAIEDFYRELREGIANGWIVEERPNKSDVVLKAV